MRSITRAGRRPIALAAGLLLVALSAAPALACGGLIGPNGAVNLLRTTTFAGYHDGVEHYVTSFEFAGGGGAFGSLTPLPGIPTSVEKGGDWTLQRLIRETDPPVPAPGLFALDTARAAASAGVSPPPWSLPRRSRPRSWPAGGSSVRTGPSTCSGRRRSRATTTAWSTT